MKTPLGIIMPVVEHRTYLKPPTSCSEANTKTSWKGGKAQHVQETMAYFKLS
jgi:hypothetical protein